MSLMTKILLGSAAAYLGVGVVYAARDLRRKPIAAKDLGDGAITALTWPIIALGDAVHFAP